MCVIYDIGNCMGFRNCNIVKHCQLSSSRVCFFIPVLDAFLFYLYVVNNCGNNIIYWSPFVLVIVMSSFYINFVHMLLPNEPSLDFAEYILLLTLRYTFCCVIYFMTIQTFMFMVLGKYL